MIVAILIILYLFCELEVVPFESLQQKIWVGVGGTCIILFGIMNQIYLPDTLFEWLWVLAVNLLLLILCRSVSRHKDVRFWFIFITAELVGWLSYIMADSLTMMAGLGMEWTAVPELLIMGGCFYVCRHFARRWEAVIDGVKDNWKLSLSTMLVCFIFSFILLFYPTPWRQRPEYAPVFLGYAVVVLMVCGLIFGQAVYHAHFFHRQIQPHFIYNVLSSIRILVKEDAQAAYDILDDLDNYLRINMDALAMPDQIHWQQELEHIRLYERIEKMRLGERVKIVYELEAEDFLLPPLIIEPLVENAVKHGIEPKAEGGTVWVRSYPFEDGYMIMVEDDGVGFDSRNPRQMEDIGYTYIRTRILETPGAYMNIRSAPGRGTSICIYFMQGD
jgi:hypothetical protein